MRRRYEKIPGFVSKRSWPVPVVARNAIRMAAAEAFLHTLLKSASLLNVRVLKKRRSIEL